MMTMAEIRSVSAASFPRFAGTPIWLDIRLRGRASTTAR